MVIAKYEMGSKEVLDFVVNFNPKLSIDGDTEASSSSVVATNEGTNTATIGNGTNGAPAPSVSGGLAKAWVVLGTVGHVYKINYVLTTEGGRKHEESIEITVIDK